MRALYVVFVLSILVLTWTAIAVARHIRRHEVHGEPPAETLDEPEIVVKPDSE
ncbi:MAG TPA: hypothetical protein VHB45_11515 [Alloacidobacterium sp.]|nr:hypothetical protein [Alloacidobacterium sp.]